jgi:hypothetical protein
LTQLAREPERGVALDLDDDGRILYLFGGEELSPRWRIDAPAADREAEAEQEQAEAEMHDRERMRR